MVPYLTNYTRNSIGLDPTTLPDDVDLPQTNVNVYPTRGAVVKASFATMVGYKVLLTLKHGQDMVPGRWPLWRIRSRVRISAGL